MENLFQVPALIQGVSTLRDKTLKLTVYTSKELPENQVAVLFSLNMKEGWLLFKENPIQPTDIPKEPAQVNTKAKSLSERLYNVLYVYHSQNFSNDFNAWRAQEMEKIIEDYKRRLR